MLLLLVVMLTFPIVNFASYLDVYEIVEFEVTMAILTPIGRPLQVTTSASILDDLSQILFPSIVFVRYIHFSTKGKEAFAIC